jgi:hypothetical protein
MKNLKVKKAFVEVNVLKVGERQCTQAFVRQIPVFDDFDLAKEILRYGAEGLQSRKEYDIEVLGWINYMPDRPDPNKMGTDLRHIWLECTILIVVDGELMRLHATKNEALPFDQLYISI